MMRRLSSPLVLGCFGYTICGGGNSSVDQLMIVTDFACYTSLDRILENSNVPDLPAALRLAWLRDIIGALRFIHSRGVKHRNVDPAHMLVFEKFRIKLTHFGESSQNGCLAPEVRDGNPSDFGSDIYSWAITAIIVITRCAVDIRGDTIRTQAVEAVQEFAAVEMFKEELAKLLLDCLKYDSRSPSNSDIRPSASEVWRRLDEVLSVNGGDPRDMNTESHCQIISILEQLILTLSDFSGTTREEAMSRTSDIESESPAVRRPNLCDFVSSMVWNLLCCCVDDVREAQPPPLIRDEVISLEEAFRLLRGATSSELVEKCFERISMFSNSDIRAIADGVEVILTAMIAHASEHCGVALKGCNVLWKLSESADYIEEIANAGGIGVILSVIRAHANHAGVAENGCSALNNLAVNDFNMVSIADSGGIKAILLAVQEHASNANVVCKGCGVLRNLACNAENQLAIAKADGIACILTAISVHEHDARVAYKGIGALRNLASHCEIQVAIAAAGGIEVILDAMRVHSIHPGVIEKSCAALGALAVDNSRNQTHIGNAGGVDIIISSMCALDSNVDVVEQACGALGNLTAYNAGNKMAVADGEGIGAILSAMLDHFGNRDLVEKGCFVLWNLVSNNERNKVLIQSAGGKELLSEVLRTYSSEGVIVSYAKRILDALP